MNSENMDEKKEQEVIREVYKKNNLNTKFLPPLFMLVAGLISFIICLIYGYQMSTLLLVLFISMLVFAILGTIVKTVVDGFNMHMDYEDLLDIEGEIVDKGSQD